MHSKGANMKITVIGCGNAFSMINFNQSFLLEENGKKMLIDCGSRVPLALINSGIKLSDLDAIYISHAHADHIGGLEEMAFTRYDWMRHPRKWDDFTSTPSERDYMDPNVSYVQYAPKLIANEKLMTELWDYSLRGGLDSMEGFDSNLDTFFQPVPVKANVPFYWQDYRFDLIQQIHIMTGSIIKYTFGLFMSKKDHKSVYFTTDSQHCSPRQIEIFYKKADMIFQDCECTGIDTAIKEYKFGSGVHASYAQLAGWPSANAVKLLPDIKDKMYLSHYQDFVSKMKDGFGNNCDWYAMAKEDGFAGFVAVGDTFEV
jgi:ribonuclease BN (tRNA processing enzyme)